MNYAPVIIPTLCRYAHLRRCIDSLSKCENAIYTPLFIFLDYPAKEEHEHGYNKIKKYLEEVSGFKTITIVEREKNYGAVNNIDDGIKYVLKLYDRFILSEDDNEFSPNFIDYINSCLVKYKENDKVVVITGYNRMINMEGYDKNIYPAISYSAFGAGFTKENYQYFQTEILNKEYAKSIIKSWKKSFEIYRTYPQLLRSLLSIMKSGDIAGDVLIVSYMVLNKKYCIWPTISKVRNHGYDGGGEHYGSNLGHPMLTQLIDENSNFEPDDIEIQENEMIKLRTKEYGAKQQPLLRKLIFKVYTPLRYLIYRFTGIIIYK